MVSVHSVQWLPPYILFLFHRIVSNQFSWKHCVHFVCCVQCKDWTQSSWRPRHLYLEIEYFKCWLSYDGLAWDSPSRRTGRDSTTLLVADAASSLSLCNTEAAGYRPNRSLRSVARLILLFDLLKSEKNMNVAIFPYYQSWHVLVINSKDEQIVADVMTHLAVLQYIKKPVSRTGSSSHNNQWGCSTLILDI